MSAGIEPCFDSRVVFDDGQPIIVCSGELDMAGVTCLWSCVEGALSSRRPLVLDMSATTFIDSAGLRLLFQAYRAVGQIKEALVLRAPSPAVLRVLAMAGCDEMFRIERSGETQGAPVDLGLDGAVDAAGADGGVGPEEPPV